MKLTSIEINHFKAVHSIQINFNDQVTVFHGPNATGKTTVLESISVGLHDFIHKLDRSADPCRLAKSLNWKQCNIKVSAKDNNGAIWWEIPLVEPIDPNRHGEIIARRFREDNLEVDQVDHPTDMPLLYKYYGTERMIVSTPPNMPYPPAVTDRLAAHRGACSGEIIFKNFLDWFQGKYLEEFIEQKNREDFSFTLPELDAFRQALQLMLPELSTPRISNDPKTRKPEFRLDEQLQGAGEASERTIMQLGGGYRVILALVADLVSRMVQANPHRETPREAEAIVLIDEIDLHLHPRWQQRVIPDLQRAFPNTQFIITTHSPQVLSTLKPSQIILLGRQEDGIVCEPLDDNHWTFGAEAGDVLKVVMDVNERPNNSFTQALERYDKMINEGKGETNEARALRKDLEQLSPNDPGIHEADFEIMRLKLFGSRASES